VLHAIWAIVLLVLVIAACSGDSGSTDLNVVLRNAGGEENTYRLQCDPPRGTVPNPRAACQALADHTETMLAQPTGGLCLGGLGTMFVDVRGQYRGKMIATELYACGGNGQGLAQWLQHLPFPPTGNACNAGPRARERIETRLHSQLAAQPKDGAKGHVAPGRLAGVHCEETVLSFRGSRIFHCAATYQRGLRLDICAALINTEVRTSREQETLNCLPT
jgi:Subtilisin inhibitor-like